MKYMGIDFGTKRVGIALSDESATLARPVTVLKNDSNLISTIENLIAKEGVESIVVGASEGNPVQRDIEEFIGTITLATMLPIAMMNEAFTSMEAHGRKGKESLSARQGKAPQKPSDLDAQAAAMILQRYLDAHSRK
jgi:putative Holliday junction resolvase